VRRRAFFSSREVVNCRWNWRTWGRGARKAAEAVVVVVGESVEDAILEEDAIDAEVRVLS
jgi:hypothetical protein